MKKMLPILLISFLMVFLCVGNSMATLFDWSRGEYVEEDIVHNDSTGFVGPGYGGQAYDVERLGMYADQGYVYFGLKTGFDLGSGLVGSNHAGDFALDTNGDGFFDHAIQLTFSGGGIFTALYREANSGSGEWQDPVHYNSDPYADGEYPWKMDTTNTASWSKVTDIFGVEIQKVSDSWFLEGSFDLSDIGTSLDDMTISWTMECGNDVLQYQPAPVPEPATMLLLGTGLLGLAGLGRKKFFKK